MNREASRRLKLMCVEFVRPWTAVSVAAIALLMPTAYAHEDSSRPGRLGQMTSVPERGTWKSGAFVPYGRDLQVTNKYYGLAHKSHYTDIMVWDSSGKFYYTSSGMQYFDNKYHSQGQTPGGFPIIGGMGQMSGSENSGAAKPVSPPAAPTKSCTDVRNCIALQSGKGMPLNPQARAWLDGSTQELIGDDQVRWKIPAEVSPQTLIYGPKKLSWTSGDGAIDLKGETVAPGFWVYMSTPLEAGNEKSDMFETFVFYRVTGAYSGQQVKGFVAVYDHWGQRNFPDSWWATNRKGAWMMWASTYDDGTAEAGTFMCNSPYGRGGIITNSKGQVVLNTQQANAKAEEDQDGTPRLITFSFGNGQKWEYVGDLKRTNLPGNGRTGVGSGVVRRVGETRKILGQAVYDNHWGHGCSEQKLVDDQGHR